MKVICVNCQCEMKPEVVGTVVVEMAGEDFYKGWHADTLKCPGCGIEVVTGFADNPFIHAGEVAFREKLKAAGQAARKVVYDYERPRPR